MDSLTHIEFARALLDRVGAPPHLAIAALFPEIDRSPDPRRRHAHSVLKARALTELGMRIFFDGRLSDSERATSTYKRFCEEESRLWAFLDPYGFTERLHHGGGTQVAAKLAFVSHLYLDAFHRPTQAFSPLSVHFAGHWKLLRSLGELRAAFYTSDTIHRLRADFFVHPVWRRGPRLHAAPLLEAMVSRLAELSLPRVPQDVVDQAIESLAIPRATACDVENNFLLQVETVLEDLHAKVYSSAVAPS